MGIYEAPERALVEKWLVAGDQVLELGASIGIVSSVIGKTIGERGKLVCVEANETLAPAFRRQLELNTTNAVLVHCLACPIWAEQPPDSVRRKSFVPSADSLAGRAEAGPGGNATRWRTVGELCAANALAPSALVLDIEGAEGVWAECAPCFPPELKTIIVELHPKIIGGTQTARSISAVFAEGFQLVDMQGDVFVFRRT